MFYRVLNAPLTVYLLKEMKSYFKGTFNQYKLVVSDFTDKMLHNSMVPLSKTRTGKFYPRKLPLGILPLRKLTPTKIAPLKTGPENWPLKNYPLRNLFPGKCLRS